VIVIGMVKVAPWQLDVALRSIEAASARSIGIVVCAAIDTGRSPGGTFKVTTGRASVLMHPECPASGVMVPPVLRVTPTRETGKLFGFVTLKTTSPVPPGRRGADGVPAVATVTVNMVPLRAEPVPEPWVVK
jgi:hypothetical protein